MIDTTQFATDLSGMIADLPASMTAAFLTASPIDVSVAELSAETTLILTGDQDKKAFACTLPISATSRPPKAQDRVVITSQGESAGTDYQVRQANRAADGIAYTLLLIQDVRKPQ